MENVFILTRSQVCQQDCSETYLARNGLFSAGFFFLPQTPHLLALLQPAGTSLPTSTLLGRVAYLFLSHSSGHLLGEKG